MKKVIIFFLSFGVIFVLGCNKNDTIKQGDIVTINYTGNFEDGKLFETGKRTIKIGSGEFLSGIDNFLLDKSLNKKYKTKIAPEQGYGFLYSKDNQQRISSLIFEKLGISTKIGTTATLDKTTGTITNHEKDENGNTIIVFDVNPPETRQDLSYEIYVESFKSN